MTSPPTSGWQQITQTCSFSVMFRWQFLDNVSTSFEKVCGFGKGDSSESFFVLLAIRHFLEKTPVWQFSLYAMTNVRRCRLSSVARCDSPISRELFDLESPNFTPIYIPVRSTTTSDLTSLATSSWQLLKFLKRLKMPRFKRGSQNFTRLSWTSGPTNLPYMTSLAVSSWLQNPTKCCSKVHKTGPAGQRVK